ncbi:DUF3293 domain-containing protein [Algibacillus agarilyticus]|uniref:DUF3293 domain-containing protein n=1 Tax=Algibacillus agarilyticus TaxID=2234133 RepID=UPI000DCFF568|nr:DUF3293 domain-containing protein [Algibacillus agarilyticus]
MPTFWELYKSTKFVFQQTVSSEIDFAIISACNPRGQILTSSHNRIRDKALQNDIYHLDAIYRSVYGCSPSLDFHEKSWLVGIDKIAAIQLAIKYEQNAIFWVEQGQLYLVPCLLTTESEVHLGLFKERLITSSHHCLTEVRAVDLMFA